MLDPINPQPPTLDQTATLRRKLASNAALTSRATQQLNNADVLGFADLISVTRPMGHGFTTACPGHFKGYLDFDSLEEVARVVEELPASFPSKKEALKHGISLIFCYANPIPLMPHVSGVFIV